ncbi:acylphosphatase [Microbacterium sp. Bi128]|uniref:acylphosphatase n=1 Tax=Microbacterium sp. Bi128 TaxID=2821115 RepID=UPI001D84A750|nr:acylphosphatase [Microbacterium sp. Bi128]CAH0237218.1 Acylphosphatase [Microbacterium sp. Bi128]
MRTVEITVHGHVQGVGFRWAMRAEAQKRHVTGWVRNRREGAVQARVSGTPNDVEGMVAWAHHGPPLARVARVDEVEVDGAEVVNGFEILDSV